MSADRPAGLASQLPDGGDDEQLVRLAAGGRRDAFEALVRRHADHLHAVVARFNGDAAEAEEVVQESFLRAWRGLGSFEGRSQFFTWLCRIAFNEAKRRGARRPPDGTRSEPERLLEVVPDRRESPEVRAEQRDLRGALEEAVRALPEIYRAPLILRDVEGLSTIEAAGILEVGEAAFKSRLHRARLSVRDAVAGYVDEGG